MPASEHIPARLVRVAPGQPTIDREKRTIASTVMTRLLARDGGIVLPQGVITRAFLANPVVQARHGFMGGDKCPVIGRSLSLTSTVAGMTSVTQFADTELGREYAYLYGMNDAGEVYMRAWSFGWNTLQVRWVSLFEAKSMLGADWDEELVPAWCREQDSCWIAEKSEMLEYSAVPVGADRDCLSRAAASGVRAAGELVAGMDLDVAARELRETKRQNQDLASRVAKLEKDLMALRRDGAAAAARGDTAELLRLAEQLRQESRRE